MVWGGNGFRGGVGLGVDEVAGRGMTSGRAVVRLRTPHPVVVTTESPSLIVRARLGPERAQALIFLSSVIGSGALEDRTRRGALGGPMSRRTQKPSSAAHPVVVAFQIFLVLATLLAPIRSRLRIRLPRRANLLPPSRRRPPIRPRPRPRSPRLLRRKSRQRHRPRSRLSRQRTRRPRPRPKNLPRPRPMSRRSRPPTRRPRRRRLSPRSRRPLSRRRSRPPSRRRRPSPLPDPDDEPSAPVAAPTIQSDLDDYPPAASSRSPAPTGSQASRSTSS
jgi:hypothetical protein